MLSPGDEIKGRYKVESVIGQGGMGAVYLADDWLYKQKCALKEMLNNFSDPKEKEEAIKRFQNEAQILVKIEHKNIPRIIDYFIENNCYYLVMKYVDGKNLQQLMIENKEGRFPEYQVLDWGIQICEVLEYLHSQKPDPIVFRDIKPSNVMIQPDGNLMLVDFGIAKILQPKAAGTITGTPGFASPEQYQGLAFPVSDVYSLGATLHYLLSGRDPQKSVPFSFPRIGPEGGPVSQLEDVLIKAFSMKMEDRYQSVTEMKNSLVFCRKTAVKLVPPVFHTPPGVSVSNRAIPGQKEPDLSVKEPDFVHVVESDLHVKGKENKSEVILKEECDEIPLEIEFKTEMFMSGKKENKKQKIFGKTLIFIIYALLTFSFLSLSIYFIDEYYRDKKINTIYDEGNKYFDDEKYKKAIEKYQQILLLSPDDIKAQRDIGRAYMELKEYDYAKLYIERALDIDSKDEESNLAMANLFMKQKDVFNGQIWYKKVLVINEDNPEAINGLGDTYFALGDHLLAVDEYKKILKLDPDSLPIRMKIAAVYKDKKDYENAIKWYTITIKQKENYPPARLGMADVYIIVKKYDDAISQYEKILDFEAKNTDAMSGIGEAQRKKNLYSKKYDKALQWFDKALDIDRNCIKAIRGKADIYISQNKNLDKVLDMINRCMKKDKNDPLNHLTMGNYYVVKEEFDKAIKSYKKAIELDKKLPQAYYNLGRIYAYRENYDDAVVKYKKAIDLDPLEASYHYNLGRAYERQGEVEKAVKEYNIAIGLKSEYTPAYYSLGLIYLRIGRFSDAAGCFKKVIDLEPDSDLAKEAEKGIKIAQFYI